MKKLFFLIALFFLGNCGMHVQMSTGDNPAEKAKRAADCKNLCNKEHYNVTFIRHDGTVEYYKIGVVSITKKTACECRF